MSLELLGPLIEGSIVGGLTALLLGYEHSKKVNNNGDLSHFVATINTIKKKKGITKQKGDPFIGSAYVFLFTEILLGIGYFIYVFVGHVYWIINIAYISFIIAIILLIRALPEIQKGNRLDQLEKK